MAQQPIRFNDGAAYENGMGIWSQILQERYSSTGWPLPQPCSGWMLAAATARLLSWLQKVVCQRSCKE